jgi:hypothetical protein
MSDMAKNPLLIVVAVIGLVIAIGVIVEAMPSAFNDWYGMVATLDADANVSDLLVLILRYAPLGLGLAFFTLFFTIVIGTAKKKGYL